MRGIALSFAILVGCHADQTSLKEDICTTLARCTSTLPAVQAQAQAKCVAQAPATISDDCANCVFEHESECGVEFNTCIPLCEPPVQGGGGNP